MSGSSVSLTTSLKRSFFWSKSKIPPQLGRAAVYVVETFRDEIDALCFHGVLRMNGLPVEAFNYTGRQYWTVSCSACVPLNSFTSSR